MFQKPKHSNASAPPIRILRSTRLARIPAIGIIARGGDAAERHGEAGVGGGVAEHLLQQLRDGLGAAEHQHPGHGHEGAADGEVAVAEQARSTTGSLRVISQGIRAIRETIEIAAALVMKGL